MALDAVKNFAKVTVSTGYDASATSIVLNGGEGSKLPLPSSDGEFNLVWYNATDYPDPSDDPNVEITRCTARVTDTLTVTRNQESSGASTKNTSSKTYKMVLALTALSLTSIRDNQGYNITPTGTINGTNKVFTLPNSPDPAGSLDLRTNNAFSIQDEDYTLSGNQITYEHAPPEGSIHRAFYKY